MSTALLLLEIQNDYFPNGRIPLEKSVEATAKAQTVLQVFRDRKQPILHIQHISTQPDASSLLPCTKGADFYASVQPQKGEVIIKKHYPNSFKDTNLLNHLHKNQIKHLVICGMMMHSTVEATVRAACDLSFNCTVIHDACTARQLEFNHTIIPAQNVHYAYLAGLQANYATILSTEEYVQKANARGTAAMA